MCTPFKCVHTGYDPVICLHCSTYKVFFFLGGGGGGGGIKDVVAHLSGCVECGPSRVMEASELTNKAAMASC